MFLPPGRRSFALRIGLLGVLLGLFPAHAQSASPGTQAEAWFADGRYADAASQYDLAAEDRAQAGDREAEALYLLQAARSYRLADGFEQARDRAQRAVNAAEAHQDAEVAAEALRFLAELSVLEEDHATAYTTLQRAFDAQRTAGRALAERAEQTLADSLAAQRRRVAPATPAHVAPASSARPVGFGLLAGLFAVGMALFAYLWRDADRQRRAARIEAIEWRQTIAEQRAQADALRRERDRLTQAERLRTQHSLGLVQLFHAPHTLAVGGRALGATLERTLFDTLSHHVRAGAVEIALPPMVDEVVGRLAAAFQAEARGVSVLVRCDRLVLPVTTTALVVLWVQEALMNAFQHAFQGRRGGQLVVSLTEDRDGAVSLAVSDDGCGFEAALDPATALTRGLARMRKLANLLEAAFQVERDPMTRLSLTFRTESPPVAESRSSLATPAGTAPVPLESRSTPVQDVTL